MSRSLLVTSCGVGTTVQDGGRFGYQRYGVGPAGAMDRLALALANMLVGNPDDAAAIEFAVFGGVFLLEGGDARVALAGAAADLSVDGERVPPGSSASVRAGQAISVGVARIGAFAVLAISGGIATQPDLGSRSFHLRAGLGGVDRKRVEAGQRLPLGDQPPGAPLRLGMEPRVSGGPFRVVFGPQDDYFSDLGKSTLLNEHYLVSTEADRMGYRLTGPKIEHAKGFNIVSDGIVTGSIQVPGAGEPIVLLADRQTTGGYPKIATVISADLPRFAQLRPGGEVRFAAVTREEAIAAARERAAMLAAVRAGLIPLDGGMSSERLLSLNLVDGWVSG